MAKVFPCLWFDGNAEEAAEFYVTLLPNSHVDNVWRSPAETPSGPEGMVLTVDFTAAGQQLQGLNGGAEFRFNESVSFVIDCSPMLASFCGVRPNTITSSTSARVAYTAAWTCPKPVPNNPIFTVANSLRAIRSASRPTS